MKSLISNLKTKIKLLEEKHEFSDVISYYEGKMAKLKKKCFSYIKLFSQILNGVTVSNNNKEKIWTDIVNKLQNHIVTLESELEEFQKSERMASNQSKIISRYNSDVENKYNILENKYKQQKKYVYLLGEKYQTVKAENELLFKNYQLLKEEYIKAKRRLSSDTVVDWTDMKLGLEHIQRSESGPQMKKQESSAKNIQIVLDNMKEYLVNYQKSLADLNLCERDSNLFDLEHLVEIISDVKNYLTFLVNKIDSLSLNQFKIINECCNFYEQISGKHSQKNATSDRIELFLRSLNALCSKLLFELAPPDKSIKE